MKLLAIALFLAAIIADRTLGDELPPEKIAVVRKFATDCIMQSNISVSDTIILTAGDFKHISEDLKCFINCFLEKTEVMKDGVVQKKTIEDKMKELPGYQQNNPVIDKCNAVQGKDKCDTAFKLFECYYINKNNTKISK